MRTSSAPSSKALTPSLISMKASWCPLAKPDPNSARLIAKLTMIFLPLGISENRN